MEVRGEPQRLALDADQPADLPRRRRPPRPSRSGATLRFTDVGAYFGGSYWKVHQLARFELRRVGPEGNLGGVVRISPKLNYCLRDLERTRPGRRSPANRHYPGCNQNPYQDRVTLGTSVGWSDIYPADYDKQWINVAGLRGCFAFVMTVDPQHLLFESNEHDNSSRRLVRLPFRGNGCWPAQPRPTEARALAEVARGEGAVAQDRPAAVLLDRGDVDDGRGQAGQLAAVDRQVGAGDDRRRGRPRSAPAPARR